MDYESLLRHYAALSDTSSMIATVREWHSIGTERAVIKRSLLVLVFKHVSPVHGPAAFTQILHWLSEWRQDGKDTTLIRICRCIAQPTFRLQPADEWCAVQLLEPLSLTRGLSDSSTFVQCVCQFCPSCKPHETWNGEDPLAPGLSPDHNSPTTCATCRPWTPDVRRAVAQFELAATKSLGSVYSIAYQISLLDPPEQPVSPHTAEAWTVQTRRAHRADSLLFEWILSRRHQDKSYQEHVTRLRDLYYLFDSDRFIFLLHAVYAFMS